MKNEMAFLSDVPPTDSISASTLLHCTLWNYNAETCPVHVGIGEMGRYSSFSMSKDGDGAFLQDMDVGLSQEQSREDAMERNRFGKAQKESYRTLRARECGQDGRGDPQDWEKEGHEDGGPRMHKGKG